MVQLVFLTPQFFKDYGHCEHIMKKQDRPYACILLDMDGVYYCVPFRSNISHPHAYWTDKKNRCGIDYGNTVAIVSPEKYIDFDSKPQLRQKEFNYLKGKDYQIEIGLRKYLNDYKKAKQRLDIHRNYILVSHSSLQYFEEILPE